MAVSSKAASRLAFLSIEQQPHGHKVVGSIPRNQFVGHGKVLQVKCMTEPELQPGDVPPIPPLPPPLPPKTEVSANFRDIFAFNGPAPETINGRLAMLGFASAVGVEAATGNDLLSQLNNGGVSWFLLTASVFSAASLIPMLKGVTRESRSGALMSSDAEAWNCRLAMVGLMALALTEYFRGGPLV